MIKILKTNKELYDTVIKLSAKSKKAYVSSFGLWAGVKADGSLVPYPSPSRDALGALEKIKTKMIVGQPDLYPCTPHCPHCADKFNEQRNRIGVTLQRFNINSRICTENHGKYYIFDKHVIVGGMNFSTSTWVDYMFVIKNDALRRCLLKEFNKKWKGGTIIREV